MTREEQIDSCTLLAVRRWKLTSLDKLKDILRSIPERPALYSAELWLFMQDVEWVWRGRQAA